MTSVSNPASHTFHCPSCRAPLSNTESGSYSCRSCARTWPVLSGIPRFFEEKAHYWGEVDRQRADTMLRDARTTSWVEAAKKHLQPHLWDYLFDTERAAWLPLVGLESDSVALDIGSGYGGITHALSNSAQTVYSLEAVPERVEFTQIRLQQSQVSNVVLVQGSALELPFAPKSFDLIVVNGVLEW